MRDAPHPSARQTESVLPGFTLRPPTWDDLPSVIDLRADAAYERPHRVALRTEDLRARWLAMADDDQAWLIERPGADQRLAAYVAFEVDPDPERDELVLHVDGIIHPVWQGHGIGSSLMMQATQVARQAAHGHRLGRVVVRTATSGDDPHAAAWLTARGFVAVRHLLELRLDLHAPPPAPAWPPGVTVRPYRPGPDDTALWQAHRAAFADVATASALTREELLASRLGDRRAIDPGLVLLAEHHDQIVGFAIGRAGTEVAAEDGWVRDLGVVPAFRRRGIGMALLRAAFAAFRARGLTGVALEVDDVTLLGAVALYRRAGMRVVWRTDVLERVLPPEATGGVATAGHEDANGDVARTSPTRT